MPSLCSTRFLQNGKVADTEQDAFRNTSIAHTSFDASILIVVDKTSPCNTNRTPAPALHYLRYIPVWPFPHINFTEPHPCRIKPNQDTAIETATTRDNKQVDLRGQREFLIPQRIPSLGYFIFEEIADGCLHYHIYEYVRIRV